MDKRHEAEFMGIVKKKRYKYDYKRSIYSRSSDEEREILETYVYDYEPIFNTNYKNPHLKVDDYIKIENVDVNIRVDKIARDCEGNYIYYLDHIIKEVEDEDTERTLHEAKKQELRFKQIELENKEKLLIEKIENANRELKSQLVTVPMQNCTKKWYQFWK